MRRIRCTTSTVEQVGFFGKGGVFALRYVWVGSHLALGDAAARQCVLGALLGAVELLHDLAQGVALRRRFGEPLQHRRLLHGEKEKRGKRLSACEWRLFLFLFGRQNK